MVAKSVFPATPEGTDEVVIDGGVFLEMVGVGRVVMIVRGNILLVEAFSLSMTST